MSAIQVKQVVKQYKNGVQALNGISLFALNRERFSLCLDKTVPVNPHCSESDNLFAADIR